MNKKCVKCNNSILTTQHLQCCLCNQQYHIDCVNVSEKRFYLMEKDKKLEWQCLNCTNELKHTDNTVQLNPSTSQINNITHRRKRLAEVISADESFESIQSDNISDLEPEITNNCQNYAQTIQEEFITIIKGLELRLSAMENEIKKISLENGFLRKCIQDRGLGTGDHVRSSVINGCSAGEPEMDGCLNVSIAESQHPVDSQHYADSQHHAKLPPKSRIYIMGAQQTVGLASQLAVSRYSSQFDNYTVSSMTKPNAKAQEILKYCSGINPTTSDYVIINVGENDENPTVLSYELSAALKQLENTNVFILRVNNCRYLNDMPINNMYKTICSNLKHCTYLDIPKKLYYKHKNYLLDVCKVLNYYIDVKNYNSKYLPMFQKSQQCKALDCNKCADCNDIVLNFKNSKNAKNVPYNHSFETFFRG